MSAPMRGAGGSRIWRAALLACALIFASGKLMAGTLASSVSGADDPFGLSSAVVTKGTLLRKWLDTEREVDHERLVLATCQRDRASCQSQTALQFLAIVDGGRSLEGRARLGVINRAINLKIKPMSDFALYGAEDVWSAPLDTFAKGAGDCEDYAIAKFVALQEAGVSADDLRIVVLRNNFPQEDHAVLAARLDGHWLILDNRHLLMAEAKQVEHYLKPVFLIDHDGVRRYSPAPAAR